MKLVRPALAVTAVAALSLALVPAQAAQGPVVIMDAAGDANAVNGQGFVDGPSDMSTAPASMASMDIVSVTLANTGTTRKVKQGKKVATVFDCTGFTATLELGAAPFQSAIYRVTGSGPVNVSQWWLTYTNDATGSTGALEYDSGDGTDPLAGGVVDVPVTVVDNKVTWTVKTSTIKASGEKLGFDWSAIGAHSRLIAGVATVPLVDETPAETFFKPCG